MVGSMDLEPLATAAINRVTGARIAWLTTLRQDGSPHTTPVWFVYSERLVWVVSAIKNVKVRNVRNDPRVSVAIDGSANAPLVAQGTTELVPVQQVDGTITSAFAGKYNGWNITDESPDGERVVLKIKPDRWLLSG
jgi:PPOX class probable F420-dependent enzyme